MSWLDYSKNNPMGKPNTEIPHYYGDTVRFLFVIATAVWFVTLPFYPELLPFDPAIQVMAGVAIIALAALTNPQKNLIIAADAIFAGVGIVTFEVVAIYGYKSGTIFEFLIRELIVVLFIVALYLSLKTLRAMFMHELGHAPGDSFEQKS